MRNQPKLNSRENKGLFAGPRPRSFSSASTHIPSVSVPSSIPIPPLEAHPGNNTPLSPTTNRANSIQSPDIWNFKMNIKDVEQPKKFKPESQNGSDLKAEGMKGIYYNSRLIANPSLDKTKTVSSKAEVIADEATTGKPKPEGSPVKDKGIPKKTVEVEIRGSSKKFEANSANGSESSSSKPKARDGLNPAADRYAPPRRIPKHWQTQCRWTIPPNDDGRGVDNCRFGVKCNFGHPGETYFEWPGVKQTFFDGYNTSLVGNTPPISSVNGAVYAINPGVMNAHLMHQRFGANPSYPYPVPPYYQYMYPQRVHQIHPVHPMQYHPQVAPPFTPSYSRNVSESVSNSQSTVTVAGSAPGSPEKPKDGKDDGYRAPVIVKSPEPNSPPPVVERTPGRRSCSKDSVSSGGSENSGHTRTSRRKVISSDEK